MGGFPFRWMRAICIAICGLISFSSAPASPPTLNEEPVVGLWYAGGGDFLYTVGPSAGRKADLPQTRKWDARTLQLSAGIGDLERSPNAASVSLVAAS